MKKVMFAAMMAGGLFLTSCGGGSDATADAKKICDCLEAAKEDPSKAEECTKMTNEMEEKYKGDLTGTAEFAATMTECMQVGE